MGAEVKREKWKERIKEWKKSGQTQQQWCESKGYSYPQFKYWKNRIKKENGPLSSEKFQYLPMETAPKGAVANPKELVVVIRVGKVEIEIKGEGGQDFLQKLIREENAYV